MSGRYPLSLGVVHGDECQPMSASVTGTHRKGEFALDEEKLGARGELERPVG